MDDLVGALAGFRGQRVLITGDTGFKGSWLALWLKEAGAEVYGYALPPAGPQDHFVVAGLGRRIVHEDGDLRDLAALQAFFRKAAPHTVFHLAAQALVRRSYRDPKETFDTNVGGSVNLLECVRATASVQTLVYVTSDKCYRNREWVWGYRENDELGGHDPYSASKAAAELVFAAYEASFFAERAGFGCASVRAGNVIGGGDWAEDRLVPDCIRALAAGKAITLRKPHATRPWQHVLEPLSGYLTLAQALGREPKRFSGAWNFGPPQSAERSVEAITRSVMSQWGSGTLEIAPLFTDPHEAGRLSLNCDKAHEVLNWWPRWSVERAVSETVRWYQAALEGQDPHVISCAQIHAYLDRSHD